MRKIFKELKRHTWVIIFLFLFSLNTYGINKNTQYIRNNVVSTTIIADSVSQLAETTSRFIKVYVKDRSLTKEMLKNISYDVLMNKSGIKINHKGVSAALENSAISMLEIEKLKRKPTYNYLKAVTVYITGESYIMGQTRINGIQIPVKTFISKWRGTGVVVKIDKDYTYVLTNKHVAGGYEKYQSDIFVSNYKKKERCEIIKLHGSQDLAVMKFKGHIKGKQVVKGYNYPKITEKVYTVGHSLGRPFIYGQGYFSGTVIEHDIYQLPAIGGQSGSGIFNSNGELLGLLYSVSGVRNSIGIQWDNTRANVVKGIYVQEFLRENL